MLQGTTIGSVIIVSLKILSNNKFMKIKILFLFVIFVHLSGCGSFTPEKALENYLKAKTPPQRFNWITSESKKRFSKESFANYYEKYNPTEKILEMHRFPIDLKNGYV